MTLEKFTHFWHIKWRKMYHNFQHIHSLNFPIEKFKKSKNSHTQKIIIKKSTKMSDSIVPILFTYLFFFYAFFCAQQNYSENIARLLERQRAMNEKSDPSWEEYKLAYGKIYANEEDEKLHRDAFLGNKVIIQEHNAAFVRGEHNFTLDYSHVTDWTSDELKALSDYRPNKAAVGAMKNMAKLRAIEAKQRRQALWNKLARL